MNNLKFAFDRERDALNFWELCNLDCFWKDEKTDLNQNYLDLFNGKSFVESKNNILNHLKTIHKSLYINIFKESLSKSWELIGDEYFSRLEKIICKPISSENFTAYITTVGRCTYRRDNTFTVSLKRPLLQAVRTCGHEIMHLYVDNLYRDKISEQIGKDKFNFLNESLTVLLNLEFKDLWYVKDMGYPENKKLRSFIKKEWQKEKGFDILLNRCVEYLK